MWDLLTVNTNLWCPTAATGFLLFLSFVLKMKIQHVISCSSNSPLLSSLRRKQFEAQLRLFVFFHDCEELEAWLYERCLRLQTAGLGRDLTHIQLSQHKHKVNHTDTHRHGISTFWLWFSDHNLFYKCGRHNNIFPESLSLLIIICVYLYMCLCFSVCNCMFVCCCLSRPVLPSKKEIWVWMEHSKV